VCVLRPMRIVVAITGATGAIYGIRLLQALQVAGVTTELIVSKWARVTIEQETDFSYAEVAAMADVVHASGDVSASISSGSARIDAMVVCPCSMKTLAGIRSGYSDNLVLRAADVTLKERRKLVLVARESPLSEIHLENMLGLCRMGVVILPPMPAFYNRPHSIDDIVTHTVARILDSLGVEHELSKRWQGLDQAGD
jgi:4-hydroxy-3-polyprenylbenzoate decarboxylase